MPTQAWIDFLTGSLMVLLMQQEVGALAGLPAEVKFANTKALVDKFFVDHPGDTTPRSGL